MEDQFSNLKSDNDELYSFFDELLEIFSYMHTASLSSPENRESVGFQDLVATIIFKKQKTKDFVHECPQNAKDFAKVVEKLLEIGIVKWKLGYTLKTNVFISCIADGSLSTVKYCVEKLGANLNQKTGITSDVSQRFRQATPLYWAAYYGKADIVTYLLSKGENDLSKVAGDGNTVLSAACEHSSSTAIKMIDDLIAHGADVNDRNSDGRTPLSFATDISVIRHLLTNQASIDIRDSDGVLPVKHILMQGRREIKKVVVDLMPEDLSDEEISEMVEILFDRSFFQTAREVLSRLQDPEQKIKYWNILICKREYDSGYLGEKAEEIWSYLDELCRQNGLDLWYQSNDEYFKILAPKLEERLRNDPEELVDSLRLALGAYKYMPGIDKYVYPIHFLYMRNHSKSEIACLYLMRRFLQKLLSKELCGPSDSSNENDKKVFRAFHQVIRKVRYRTDFAIEELLEVLIDFRRYILDWSPQRIARTGFAKLIAHAIMTLMVVLNISTTESIEEHVRLQVKYAVLSIFHLIIPNKSDVWSSYEMARSNSQSSVAVFDYFQIDIYSKAKNGTDTWSVPNESLFEKFCKYSNTRVEGANIKLSNFLAAKIPNH